MEKVPNFKEVRESEKSEIPDFGNNQTVGQLLQEDISADDSAGVMEASTRTQAQYAANQDVTKANHHDHVDVFYSHARDAGNDGNIKLTGTSAYGPASFGGAEPMDPNRPESITNLIPDSDFEYVSAFHDSLELCMSCQRVLQLLCEGHNNYMQSYLRSQNENSTNVDVLQFTADLVNKLCKTELVMDYMDEKMIKCLNSSFELLIEMIQGPNMQNQEVLSVSGLVETCMKILKAKFRYLTGYVYKQQAADELEDDVRRVKANVVLCLNSILEARTDK